MPVDEKVIQDFLTLSPEERQRVHREGPDFTRDLKNFITNDPKWKGMQPTEQQKVWKELGFPDGPESITLSKPFTPGMQPDDTVRLGPVAEVPGTRPKLPLPKPTTEEIVRAQRNRTAAQNKETENRLYNTETGELLSSESLSAIKEGLRTHYSNLITQPLRDIYLGNRNDTMGQIALGVSRANPFTAPGFPTEVPRAEFMSVENAAMMATDAIMTLPLFTVATTFNPSMAAAGAFQFFTRYPGLGRMVLDSVVLGGADAGYRALVEGVGELVQKGHMRWPSMIEFGTDWLKAIGLMMGFAGVAHGARAMKNQVIPSMPDLTGAFRELGKEARVGSKGIPGEISRPEIPRPGLTSLYPEQVPHSTGAPNVSANEMPGSTQDLLLRAQLSQTRPHSGLEMTREAAPPIPGWAMTAEDKLYSRKFPRDVRPQDAPVVDNVLGPNKTEVNPDGSLTFSVSEPVLNTMFVPKRDAIPGDIVYISSKERGPQVVRVLSRTEDGLVVKGERSQFFVKFENVQRKAELPFSTGETVTRPNGDLVTVKSFSPDGKYATVIDATGGHSIDPTHLLRSMSTDEYAKQVAERAVMGVKVPPPSSGSIFEMLKDVLDPKSEKGIFNPFGFRKLKAEDDAEIAAGKLIPIYSTVEPGPQELGMWRYWIDPVYTLGATGRQEFDLIIKALFDSKQVEAVRTRGMTAMLSGMKKLVGKDSDTSEKLMRFAVGAPRPGESLSPTERGVVDAWNNFVQTEMIPAINMRRAAFGEAPVPPSYPWPTQIFPEFVLMRGANGNGAAAKIGSQITFTGVDNEILFGSTAARINVRGNFWELADRAVKMVAHENAWRNTISLVEGLAHAEKSPSTKAYLRWLSDHLDGRKVAPDLGDVVGFSRRLDLLEKRLGFYKRGSDIELPGGQKLRLDSPLINISELNLGDAAMTVKGLSYADTIGFSMRTFLTNVTQVATHVVGHMPGSKDPFGLIFDGLTAYAKVAAPLFTKKAREQYVKMGVLHDVEEIFSSPFATRVTGGPVDNLLYSSEWVLNQFKSWMYLNMRASEVINRVSTFELTKRRYESLAKGTQWEQQLTQPDFQRAIVDLSKYTSNITQFLYGKGFKSPAQESLAAPLDIHARQAQFLLAPIGELAYQYNTFSTKSIGITRLLYKQWKEQHEPLAQRLAKIDGPEEFAQFLAQMNPDSRFAILRVMGMQMATAGLITAATGLTGLWSVLYPLGQYGVNPISPSVKGLASMATELSQFDIGGAVGVARKHFVPGRTAYERWERGSNLFDKMFKTRYEAEGRPNPQAAPGPMEQLQKALGLADQEARRP